jgi:hypothetical protein
MNTETALSGTLKDFGLVEILQVVELGSMTGALHLKQGPGRTGILYFNEGKLANCSEMDPGALTLGDVLQQLGMTIYQHIEQAQAQQLQDPLGKRLGERLVLMGAISQEQLNEALRTKALWAARELALWEDGTYDFFSTQNIQKLLPHGESPLDIEVLRSTMEMVRYIDEWQELRKFLPQGMRTSLQLAPTISYPMLFDIHTFELFTHTNLYRRVRRIATALRCRELDVARDLAHLVEQRLLVSLSHDTLPQANGRKVQLPEAAEKLRLENFAFLDLISRMEQEWERQHTPTEQLPTLVKFINWTMDALGETCRTNGIALDPNTLKSLMINENLWHLGSYQFRVEQNHINVENFTTLCYDVLNGDIKQAANLYDEASMLLQRLLCSIFELINSRVANPRERIENQEVWEAMFDQFALERSKS